MSPIRQNAIACASIQLLLYLPVVALTWFTAAGGENAEPDDLREVEWLRYAAPALLLSSAATIAATARGRPWWATVGLAVQVVIGAAVLRLALDHSVHSDRTLVVSAAVVWTFGLLAVEESFRDRRRA